MPCSFASTRDYGGCAVLALRGELDVTDAAELSSQLGAVMSARSWVIVDLADLTYIDCSSLRMLMAARERARWEGGDVLLVRPHDAVTRLMWLTGWAWEFSVFPGVGVAGFSAGLAAFTSKTGGSM